MVIFNSYVKLPEGSQGMRSLPRLEGGNDVQILPFAGSARGDGPTIEHERRPRRNTDHHNWDIIGYIYIYYDIIYIYITVNI